MRCVTGGCGVREDPSLDDDSMELSESGVIVMSIIPALCGEQVYLQMPRRSYRVDSCLDVCDLLVFLNMLHVRGAIRMSAR